MSDLWSGRAEAYRTSTTHMQGDDLEAVVAMCEPEEGVKALDVATGGGHVARRLREEACEVVTVDSSPGMRPDVLSRVEDLPFADGSFDVVVCRIAAHHFADLEKAVTEMARVSNRLVVIEDTLYISEQQEEAERLRQEQRHEGCREHPRQRLDAAGDAHLVPQRPEHVVAGEQHEEIREGPHCRRALGGRRGQEPPQAL